MRKSLWIILTVLLVAIAAPNASADSYVDITVSLIFSGASVCGSPPSTCTESFSTNFEYDSTLEAIVSPPPPSTSTGDLGTFTYFTTATEPAGLAYATIFEWTDAGLDTIQIAVESTALPLTVSDLDGEAAGLLCASPSICQSDYVSVTSGPIIFPSTETISVTAVPEPDTVAFMLAGIGVLLVMRKRIGQGHRQASWTHCSPSLPAAH